MCRAKNQHKKNTRGTCTINWSTPYPTISLAFNFSMPSKGSIQNGLIRLGSASEVL